MKHELKAAALAAALIAMPASAQAQQADAASALPLGGRAITGVCVLSRNDVLANSAVGRASTTRLQQITQAAQQEVATQEQQLQTDARALENQRSSLSADQLRQRQQPLLQRQTTLQQLAAQRSRDVEATRIFAVNRISTEAQPVIQSVYNTHRCGLLIERSAVLGGAAEMDLTAEVIRGLDARIQNFTFERQNAPAPSAQ